MKRLLLLTILIGLLFTSPNSFAQSSKPKRATIKYGNGVKYVGEIRKVSPKGFIIRKMKFKQNTYIFIFTTYRGHPGDVAKRFDNLLQEKNLSLALSKGIPMPGNSYLSTVEQIKDTLANQKTNIKKLVKSIIEQDKIDYSLLPEVENSAVYKACNMRGIKVDEKCIGCQTCIKVCPMNNIELIEGKIKIKDNCMTCLACFHWCPTAAIYMSKEKEIERREKYHHPDVRLTDIIKQKYNEFVE